MKHFSEQNVVLRSPPSIIKIATIAGLLPSLAVAFAVFWPGPDLVSSRGYYLGQDFVNFWTGGNLALEGRLSEIYDRDAYDGAVKALFPAATGVLNFSYPPHILLVLMPLAQLPYEAALVFWQALGLCGFLAISLLGAARHKMLDLWPYVLLSPIVILVVTVGQASFFLALLFVGALRLIPVKPGLAGVFLGLLTIKPQLGLLLPPALLMLGERRAFAWAAATTCVLVAASILWFGVEPWRDFITQTLPFQQRVMTEMIGIYTTMMVTPYAEFWWFGIPSGAALMCHAGVAACVAIGVLLVARSGAEFSLKIAALATGAVALTPYCLNYDLAIPAAALVGWAIRRDAPVALSTLLAVGLFWFVPYFGMALVLWGIPVIPIAVLLLFGALLHEAWRTGAGETQLVLALPSAARRLDCIRTSSPGARGSLGASRMRDPLAGGWRPCRDR